MIRILLTNVTFESEYLLVFCLLLRPGSVGFVNFFAINVLAVESFLSL